MKLEKVESAKMAADSLTKTTPRPLFEYHRNIIMGHLQTAVSGSRRPDDCNLLPSGGDLGQKWYR
eukprot:1072322-Rhodomonas_salina.1